MSIIKLLIALCSHGLSIAAVNNAPSPNLLAEAEPISPATVQRFPHLSPYMGHVLLGTAAIQTVLAGVAIYQGDSAWQPALLAVFDRIGGDDQPWRRHRALDSIDLIASIGSGGGALQQLAVETGVDPDGTGAFAKFVFGAKTAGRGKSTVTWHLAGKDGRLSFVVDSYQSNHQSSTPSWQLKLRGQAKNLLGPVSEVGKFSGADYLYRYQDNDLVTISGFRRFNFKSDTQTITPAPVQPPLAPPADGLEFALSSEATAATLTRVEALRKCAAIHGFARQKIPQAEFWSQIAACVAPESSGTLTLATDPRDPAPNVMAPVYIFSNDGKPVAYVGVHTGQSVKLDLPAGSEYSLADTPEGRLIEGVKTFTIAPRQQVDLTLPPRQVGTLNIKAASLSLGASMLVLESLSDSSSSSSARFTAFDVGKDGGPYTLEGGAVMMRTEQLTGKILEGSYLVTLINGRIGIYCREKLNVAEGKATTLDCSHSSSFDPRDIGSDIAYANLNPLEFADASAVVPYALDQRQFIIQNLGLDLVGHSFRDEGLLSAQELPYLEVDSERFDIKLRYFPGTKALAKRWAQVQETGVTDNFARFAKFLRDEGESGWTELGCPGESMGLEELEQLLRTLKPTAVQFFGCQSRLNQSELLAIWARTSTDVDPPTALTPAPFDLVRPKAPFLPRIVLPMRPSSTGVPVDFWTAMQKRGYTLNAGATVQIRDLMRPPSQKSGEPEAQGMDLELALNVMPEARAREIIVYSETGIIKRWFPPADFQHKGLITIRSVPVAQSRWLRVEVRGTPPYILTDRKSENVVVETNAVLAATNYLPVVNLTPKHERPGVRS